MSRPRPVVAIDGPAGAGKSTAALRLAQELGFTLVDTGALYRGVALAAKEAGVDWQDGQALGVLTAELDLAFETAAGERPRIHINGADRSADIRSQDISMGASHVSKHPQVRDALLEQQRRLGRQGGVVLEGRDIGTVVFPDAEVKVFLTASPECRARRRVGDLAERGQSADYEQTLAEIRARDTQDSERPVAPLKPAEDGIILDTSAMDLDQVVARLVEIAEGK